MISILSNHITVKWGMKSSMWSVRHGCLLSRGLWWPDIWLLCHYSLNRQSCYMFLLLPFYPHYESCGNNTNYSYGAWIWLRIGFGLEILSTDWIFDWIFSNLCLYCVDTGEADYKVRLDHWCKGLTNFVQDLRTFILLSVINEVEVAFLTESSSQSIRFLHGP